MESFILIQFAILVPVLFGIGKIIKTTCVIPDKFIPVALALFGILFAIGLNGINVDSVIQGILIATTTVWGNEAVTNVADYVEEEKEEEKNSIEYPED